MRILTNSPFSDYGLIKVIEAENNSPQHIFFCIPVNEFEAKNIKSIDDFDDFFYRGLSTRIITDFKIDTISLQYDSNRLFGFNFEGRIPKFIANVGGFAINFHLSILNFDNYDPNKDLSFKFFYEGIIEKELFDKRFILLEPDWKVLDKLFLEKRILFTDWNE